MYENELLTSRAAVTHHCVDDVLPQDLALDSFRRHFPWPLNGARVTDNGSMMHYQPRNPDSAKVLLKSAREIIRAVDLPLTAALENNILIIRYHA